jgi:hypothetical protein
MNTATHCIEPARNVPVAGRHDVVVVGGGIAGVAAALAAARSGVSVCLVEKLYGLGGLATLGNVIVYLPLCDGRGRQVMAGITEELLRLSVEDVRLPNKTARFEQIPACWQPGGDPEARRRVRYQVRFNPAALMLALEQRVLDAGVTLMYDTRFAAVRCADGRIDHVVVENKSGRQALAAGTVIDATGDADVCAAAGEPTESLDSNVLAGWFYSLAQGALRLHVLSKRYSPNATREGADGPFFRGDVAEEVSAQLIGSRAMLRAKLAELRAKNPDTDIQPIQVPTFPCFRMTRRLVGAYSLRADDAHRWFDDAVGLMSDWRKSGPVWSIPLRTLLATHTSNLAVAGRCMSADPSVWDVTRAIPVCGVTGEAAGVAAALAVQHRGGDLTAVASRDVADGLRARGNLLSPELVAEAAAPAAE